MLGWKGELVRGSGVDLGGSPQNIDLPPRTGRGSIEFADKRLMPAPNTGMSGLAVKAKEISSWSPSLEIRQDTSGEFSPVGKAHEKGSRRLLQIAENRLHSVARTLKRAGYLRRRISAPFPLSLQPALLQAAAAGVAGCAREAAEEYPGRGARNQGSMGSSDPGFCRGTSPRIGRGMGVSIPRAGTGAALRAAPEE